MMKHHSKMIVFLISVQKLDFLGVFGLTTMGRRDELVQQKRRKRRRMLREHSPSPPASQSKRTPPPQLSTRFTPEEMDQAPELEDKKRFLTMFRLSHVTVQQRKGKAIFSEKEIRAFYTFDSLTHFCFNPPGR